MSGWADGRNGLHGGHWNLTVLDRLIFSVLCFFSGYNNIQRLEEWIFLRLQVGKGRKNTTKLGPLVRDNLGPWMDNVSK
jgi:hypothetical protein